MPAVKHSPMIYNYRMNKRLLKFIFPISIIILALLYHLCGEQLSASQRTDTISVRVVAVHDGDTVSVIIGMKNERLRLIGIDAPEIGQGLWGIKAKNHLKELLNHSGHIATLELDVEKRDKYGRILGYLWASDKKLINLEMVRDGYAVIFTFPPNVKYVDDLRKAQDFAKKKNLGIWGKDGMNEMPGEYKRKHPR